MARERVKVENGILEKVVRLSAHLAGIQIRPAWLLPWFLYGGSEYMLVVFALDSKIVTIQSRKTEDQLSKYYTKASLNKPFYRLPILISYL